MLEIQNRLRKEIYRPQQELEPCNILPQEVCDHIASTHALFFVTRDEMLRDKLYETS